MTAIQGTVIGYDVHQEQAGISGNNTVAFTIAPYDNRVVFVSMHSSNANQYTTTPNGWIKVWSGTYPSYNRGTLEVFMLVNPPVGANSYIFNMTAAANAIVVTSYYNVLPTGPTRAIYDQIVNYAPGLTVNNSVAGDLVIDFLAYAVSSGNVGSGQTALYNANYAETSYQVASGANTPMSYSASNMCSYLAFALVPYVGGNHNAQRGRERHCGNCDHRIAGYTA